MKWINLFVVVAIAIIMNKIWDFLGFNSNSNNIPIQMVTDEHWELSYNLIQMKAAHNSIERNEKIEDQLHTEIGQCSAIELDIVLDPRSISNEDWNFAVQHENNFSDASPNLATILRSIKKWSLENKQHLVVTIHIDLKLGVCHGKPEHFAEKLDSIFLKELGDSIFSPFHLQRDAKSLREGIQRYGWPKLNELRGKFIIVLTGNDMEIPVRERRVHYLNSKQTQRIAFVDIDQRAIKENGINHDAFSRGDRVFVNLMYGLQDWEKLAEEVHKIGFVTRVWKCNDKTRWNTSVKAGINLIATDRITKYEWATFGKHKFRPK